MKSTRWTSVVTMMTFVAALAITIQPSAQDSPENKHKHRKYKLMDAGTFGGPDSYFIFGPGSTLERFLNDRGTAVGSAATTASDPFYPNCFLDCFVDHAFQFKNGILTDLGALPGGSSTAIGVNDDGMAVGVSQNGSIDPLTGYPETRAVVWRNGVITDLGTLGGSLSQALMVNNRGQVAGVSANAIPDQYASGLGPCITFDCSPVATQQRAILWQSGTTVDLGTLGGNDAAAYFINDRGQVGGVSYTNTIPNPTTGNPTQDPFLWDRGHMIDLGSLGGTLGVLSALNNRSQVVGATTLAGDQAYHPFLWSNGSLSDLGTLGGDSAVAEWINDGGDVVGGSFLVDNQTVHAFLWRHGRLADLGMVQNGDCSQAWGINEGKQIVGKAGPCDGSSALAFLWEDGGPMVDLNALVDPPSNVHLNFAGNINDRGDIVARGTLPNGDTHVILLVPDGDCDSACEQRIAASQNAPKVQPATLGAMPPAFGKPADWLRNPFGKRIPMPGQPSAPAN